MSPKITFQIGQSLIGVIEFRRDRFQFRIGSGQRLIDGLQGRFLRGNIAIQCDQIVLQTSQFALAGKQGCFAADRANKQCPVSLKQFTLKRDKSKSFARPHGQSNCDFHRLHDPRICQQADSQPGCPSIRQHQAVCSHHDTRLTREIGQLFRI